MQELGKIKFYDDPRKIWKNEALDFTPWLAQDENLELLGNALNIDITLDEVESSVGNFNVDILCHEEITNRKIVIENQLEDTNHDHLGKIITYAAGKNAEILIWIVKHARDEHRQAVEWINEHTDDNIGIFLVEIQVLQIDTSKPAVFFKVIEKPNDWAKTFKSAEKITPENKINLSFWNNFNEYARTNQKFMSEFKIRKALPQYWYDLAVGSSLYHITCIRKVRDNKINCNIWITSDKNLFNTFLEHKTEIENDVGEKLTWLLLPEKKASHIDLSYSCDVGNEKEWPKYFEWLCEKAILMKKAFTKWD